MIYIYVLKLKYEKYYIGKTKNPYFRLNQHFQNKGSAWTKKYTPIRVWELIKGDDYDELKYTIKYMQQYGIDNVRGANFIRIILTDNEKTIIKQIINSITDKCYNCGQSGHYSNECTFVEVNINNTPKQIYYNTFDNINDTSNNTNNINDTNNDINTNKHDDMNNDIHNNTIQSNCLSTHLLNSNNKKNNLSITDIIFNTWDLIKKTKIFKPINNENDINCDKICRKCYGVGHDVNNCSF